MSGSAADDRNHSHDVSNLPDVSRKSSRIAADPTPFVPYLAALTDARVEAEQLDVLRAEAEGRIESEEVSEYALVTLYASTHARPRIHLQGRDGLALALGVWVEGQEGQQQVLTQHSMQSLVALLGRSRHASESSLERLPDDEELLHSNFCELSFAQKRMPARRHCADRGTEGR